MNKSSGPNVLIVLALMSTLLVVGAFMAVNNPPAHAMHDTATTQTVITLAY